MPREELQAFIDATMDLQVKDLQSLVRIPSVSRGEPREGMPFGRDVHDALEEAFRIARDLGFTEMRSLDGKCGIIDYGEGDEMLMILAHLDVVPAGNGWTVEPFGGVLKDGRVYGRGTHDDKGAAVSALYALAAVKDAGIPMRRRVRIFLGLDEEVGMGDIERYKATEQEPDLAFTPDADYPVVNGEMNIGHVTYHCPLESAGFTASIGTAGNVIPGEAEAVLSTDAAACELPEGYTLTIDGGHIAVHGTGGHAAFPETARNAMQALFEVLCAQYLPAPAYGAVSALHAMFDYDMHGESFGLDVTDASGRLTLMPTMLRADDTGITVTLDTRFPTSLSGEALLEKLDACFTACGYVRTEAGISLGHYVPEDGELVSTLMDVYETHIGHAAKPYSIGGGTYARDFKNAVAFGPTMEGAENMCHVADEYVTVADLKFNTGVMAEAIARLAGQETLNA